MFCPLPQFYSSYVISRHFARYWACHWLQFHSQGGAYIFTSCCNVAHSSTLFSPTCISFYRNKRKCSWLHCCWRAPSVLRGPKDQNNDVSIWPTFHLLTHFPRKKGLLPPFLFHETFSCRKMNDVSKFKKIL
jgi:hypothetical protein